jgi:hypothetical protein
MFHELKNNFYFVLKSGPSLQEVALTSLQFRHIIADLGNELLTDGVQEASNFCNTYTKNKAVPLQAWSGPDGSTKLRFPDFITMAEDGSKVVSLTHRSPLPPGNTPGTHFC